MPGIRLKVDASGNDRTLGIKCGRWRRAVRNEQSWKKKVLSCIFFLSARDNLGRSTAWTRRWYEKNNAYEALDLMVNILIAPFLQLHRILLEVK